MKKEKKSNLFKSMSITMLLIFLMISGSFVAVRWISKIEEEQSFIKLHEETDYLAEHIQLNIDNDRGQLEIIAAVIARAESFTDQILWDILDSYSNIGLISRLELLLPDDTIVTRHGEIRIQDSLSFDKEAALGSHITDLENDFINDGQPILRHYVPVIQNNQITAMLYGVIEVASLPSILINDPYDGEAAAYLMEGDTGNLIVDTWHSELGNLWDMGKRQMADGYDYEQLKEGLINGKSDYVVFVSETIGKYLYFYYEPLDINDWRIALSVPEDVVFENSNLVKHVTSLFLGFEIIVFIIYFIWMITYIKKETREKQLQLDMINATNNVEKYLFNAHENRNNITLALKEVAKISHAEEIYLYMKESQMHIYSWQKNEITYASLMENEVPISLFYYFKKGNQDFISFDTAEINQLLGKKHPLPVKTLGVISIRDTDNHICGFLMVVNISPRERIADFLRNIRYSFNMCYNNISTYNIIKEFGEKDMLCGVYNRNRFETNLIKYPSLYKTSLACIYIDVNGLHELNNTQGHESGDEMLKAVAQMIRENFEAEHTYRIGGDEFIIFVINTPEDVITEKIKQLKATLNSFGYSISVGMEWQTQVIDMDDLVRRAEKKMYVEKKNYYNDKNHDRRKNLT